MGWLICFVSPELSTGFVGATENFDEFVESGRTEGDEVVIIRSNRPRSIGLLALLFALSSMAGCRAAIDSDLLDVRELGPARLEPGSRLTIQGAGFPPGRVAEVRLEGVLHRPGSSERAVVESLRGRAIAPDTVEVLVDDALLESLGGRGTFEGAVRVVFDTADGEATVSGTLPDVNVDLLPRSRARMSDLAERRVRADASADALGLELAENHGHDVGVRVAAVRPGSPAMIAGVEAGDTIDTIDGLLLASSDELIIDPEAAGTRLGVRKPGSSGPVERVVRSAALTPERRAESELWLVLLLGGLAVFLLLAAPTARFTALLARAPSRPGSGLAWLTGATHLPAEPRWARLGASALGALLIALLVATISELGRRLGAAHHVGALLIALLSIQLISAISGRRGHLLAELLAFAAGAVPLLIATAGAILLLAADPEAGALAPWRWSLFANPVALLLFVAFCVSALGGLTPSPDAPSSSHWLARLHLVVAGCLGAPLFLGGLVPPVASLEEPLAMVGWLGSRSALLVLLGGWLFGRLPREAATRARFGLPFALTGLFGSVAWLGWESAGSVGAVSGPLLSGTSMVIVLYLIIGGRRAHQPELRLHPFL